MADLLQKSKKTSFWITFVVPKCVPFNYVLHGKLWAGT